MYIVSTERRPRKRPDSQPALNEFEERKWQGSAGAWVLGGWHSGASASAQQPDADRLKP
jgi:hypothetical protein